MEVFVRFTNALSSLFQKLQEMDHLLTLLTPTPENDQTHSNNSSAFADELSECVWPFCRAGVWRVEQGTKSSVTIKPRMSFHIKMVNSLYWRIREKNEKNNEFWLNVGTMKLERPSSQKVYIQYLKFWNQL